MEVLHATSWFPLSTDEGAYPIDGVPTHGSLQILVDPVIHLVEENPWSG